MKGIDPKDGRAADEAAIAECERIARRIEETMAGRGYAVEVVLKTKGPGRLSYRVEHYGVCLTGALAHSNMDTLKQLQGTLAAALRKATDEENPFAVKRHDPSRVQVDGPVDATLLAMLEEHADGQAGVEAALRRLAANGNRKWTARHLGQILARAPESGIEVERSAGGGMKAILTLGPDVTMKRGILVIRRNRIPDTVLASLIGRPVGDLVSHRWLPDTGIVRVNASPGKQGSTVYSVTLAEPYRQFAAMKAAA